MPLKTDGTKKPKLEEWKPLQKQFASDEELKKWYKPWDLVGTGIICGSISKYLECVDIDLAELYQEYKEKVENAAPELWPKLVIVRTPRPGYQILYSCPSAIEGNQKLASELVEVDGEQKEKTLIETRGEGGYVVAVGSPKEVHKNKIEYSFIQGDYSTISEITADERDILISVGRSFNRHIPLHSVVRGNANAKIDGIRPGDGYNEKVDWPDVLEPHGWVADSTSGEVTQWIKPHSSNPGTHASTNFAGSDLFYCFSSCAFPFEGGRSYTKFAAYTLLNHGGDFKQAAKQLRSQGYGAQASTGSTDAPLKSEKFKIDDIGNAERLVARHGATLKYVPEFGKFFVFNGIMWAADDLRAQRLAQETARSIFDEAKVLDDPEDIKRVGKWAAQSASLPRIKAMLELAKPLLLKSINEFDHDPFKLNVANGTIDLITGKLLPHDPADFITMASPVKFNPDAQAPLFTKFLDRVLASDESLIEFLQRSCGYTLTGDQSEQCIHFAHGAGQNGKTILISVMQHVMGDYGQVGPEDFLTQKLNRSASNDLARLVGKRFVSVVETGEGNKLDEVRLKKLTGGDKISARFLHKEYFDFIPVAKYWLVSNFKPVCNANDEATFRRIKTLPFEVRIPDAEKDPHLLDKLIAEAEGILAWMVRGCLKWQASGLQEPEKVKLATQGYRAEMDLMQQFIDDCCILEGAESPTDLVSAYKAYSGQAMSTKTLHGILTKKGFEQLKVSSGKLWLGISLKRTVRQEPPLLTAADLC